MRVIGILLLLTSCANTTLNDLFKINTDSDPRTNLNTDEVFIEYVVQFEVDYAHYLDADINIHNIPINFTDELEDKYLGVCYYYGNKSQWREIKINRSQWNTLSEHGKKSLLYHEFGHCALNREHKDEYYYNLPVSIMNTYHIGDSYKKYSDDYDYELFNNDANNLKKSIDASLEL